MIYLRKTNQNEEKENIIKNIGFRIIQHACQIVILTIMFYNLVKWFNNKIKQGLMYLVDQLFSNKKVQDSSSHFPNYQII